LIYIQFWIQCDLYRILCGYFHLSMVLDYYLMIILICKWYDVFIW